MNSTLYEISQITHYDDIELHISLGPYRCSEAEANKLAVQSLRCILKEDGLHVAFGDEHFMFKDHDKEKYHFRICTKDLPPPIDPTGMESVDLSALLNDERYMTNDSDYQRVGWSLADAYEALRKINPEKAYYSFGSLAYGVSKIRGD